MKLSYILNEYLTGSELKAVESYADRLFKSLNVDVEFSKHFLDRANDPRNNKPIDGQELKDLFTKTVMQYGVKISKLNNNAQAVLADMKTDINVPFVIVDNGRGELELISKTIMRKKDFMSSDPKLRLT